MSFIERAIAEKERRRRAPYTTIAPLNEGDDEERLISKYDYNWARLLFGSGIYNRFYSPYVVPRELTTYPVHVPTVYVCAQRWHYFERHIYIDDRGRRRSFVAVRFSLGVCVCVWRETINVVRANLCLSIRLYRNKWTITRMGRWSTTERERCARQWTISVVHEPTKQSLYVGRSYRVAEFPQFVLSSLLWFRSKRSVVGLSSKVDPKMRYAKCYAYSTNQVKQKRYASIGSYIFHKTV